MSDFRRDDGPAGPQVMDLLRQLCREVAEVKAAVAGARKPNLTVAEVARLVGRSPYTVREWVKAGRLDAVRVQGTGPKGRLLIRRESLDAIVAGGLGGEIPDAAVADGGGA